MSRKTSSILVQDVPVTVMSIDQRDYISLTDMAKARTDAGRAADVIKNWLRARSTLEFLGTWEIMYNPDFKVVEFDHFKSEAGLHTFTLSAKEWIEKTNAVGIYVQAGRYGGTYAHKDIAFEFGSAISPMRSTSAANCRTAGSGVSTRNTSGQISIISAPVTPMNSAPITVQMLPYRLASCSCPAPTQRPTSVVAAMPMP